MKISRHARNNMRLYGIRVDDLYKAIESADYRDAEESKLIAVKFLPERFTEYPLKVVYEKSGQDIFIITVYPLKKALGGKP
ncbi:MAG: DUF4258 domain-containing protein [Deltaproteobacteria bacterium]|nr:DUF4258 domain-containing protein [Deltaproteobacteria bacterium]